MSDDEWKMALDRLPDCEVKKSNPRIHTNDHEQAAGKSQMKNGK